jgi:hypothetical protein
MPGNLSAPFLIRRRGTEIMPFPDVLINESQQLGLPTRLRARDVVTLQKVTYTYEN